MPTKRRPRDRHRILDGPPLTPVLRYLALTGRWPRSSDPDGHLPHSPAGWLAALFLIRDHKLSGTVDRVVRAHREALQDEADRFGFTPWFGSRKHPDGDQYQAWRAAFVDELRDEARGRT